MSMHPLMEPTRALDTAFSLTFYKVVPELYGILRAIRNTGADNKIMSTLQFEMWYNLDAE